MGYLMSSQAASGTSIFTSFWLTEMVILSKALKPDNFECHKFLNVSFTNVWVVRSSFVGCGSFLELNSPNILALYDWIDSCNSSVAGIFVCSKRILLLICMVLWFMWRRVFLVGDLFLENFQDFYLCFDLALLHSVSFFPQLITFSSLCTVFDAIAFDIDEVLSINLSTMYFSLETPASVIRTG